MFSFDKLNLNKSIKIKSKHHLVHFSVFILLVLTSYLQSFSQNDSTSRKNNLKINKLKLGIVIGSEAVVGAASIIALNELWYKNYPRQSFHFFNDFGEWQQMDKIGHITTSYYGGVIGYSGLKWSGVNEKNSIWYGGLLGSFYLLNIEILDGFSSAWGFSWYDFTANTLGSALFIGQQLGWHQQRFELKFSFHPTQYPQYRPNLLGGNLGQQILKDYNGQTYWISANINSFLKKTSKFPKWINIAVGYGAEGMLGGKSNPAEENGVPLPEFTRYRKFLISADIDFAKIPTKSKTLKAFLTIINFIKIPFPAIEFNTKGQVKGYWLYF